MPKGPWPVLEAGLFPLAAPRSAEEDWRFPHTFSGTTAGGLSLGTVVMPPSAHSETTARPWQLPECDREIPLVQR